MLFDDLSSKVIERTARALEIAMDPGLEELVAMRGVFTGGRTVQRQSVERTMERLLPAGARFQDGACRSTLP